MPYALILAGLILLVAGVRNTESALFTLLKNDFTGQNSFVWWTLSILLVGSVGYINPELRKFANSFLALILIVLFLANSKNGQGVFAQFTAALKAPIPPAPTGNASPLASVTPQAA